MADRFPTADERWPRQGIVSKINKRIKPKDGNKTFCMAPWTHTYLSPQMERRLCCSSRESSTNFKQYIDTFDPKGNNDKMNLQTLDQHWNSDYMKSVRVKLMAGEEIPQCAVCNHKLLNEQVYRQHFNWLYRNKIEEAFASTDDTGHTTMKTESFDYRFSNLCNFSCSNETQSSRTTPMIDASMIDVPELSDSRGYLYDIIGWDFQPNVASPATFLFLAGFIEADGEDLFNYTCSTPNNWADINMGYTPGTTEEECDTSCARSCKEEYPELGYITDRTQTSGMCACYCTTYPLDCDMGFSHSYYYDNEGRYCLLYTSDAADE